MKARNGLIAIVALAAAGGAPATLAAQALPTVPLDPGFGVDGSAEPVVAGLLSIGDQAAAPDGSLLLGGSARDRPGSRTWPPERPSSCG